MNDEKRLVEDGIGSGLFYLQTVPDNQYFTDLEQILACIQLNWNNQEYIIVALKNTINYGYKLTKE